MIRCVLVDDEPLAIELLKKYILKVPEFSLANAFTDAVKAISYLNSNPVDLVFLDIQMPDISGLQLLQELKYKPLLIFTSAYAEYAVEGFNVSAIDYLLKPISEDRFLEASQRVLRYTHYQAGATADIDYILVKSQYKLVRIAFKDIDYIEGLIDYIRIHTPSYPYTTLSSMKAVLQKLPADKFMRIHRSYIVPVEKVRYIRNKKIQLLNNIELPIGDTYQHFIHKLREQVDQIRNSNPL